MNEFEALPAAILNILRDRLGDRLSEFHLPPPSFRLMQAEFVDFNLERATLTVRFPILEAYLNPYGIMQGGFTAAAVDNTLGPLSMLVAPPNFTRRLEMTYSHPITLEMEHIIVTGRLLEQHGQRLHLGADVNDPHGARLARAKALHWIYDGR